MLTIIIPAVLTLIVAMIIMSVKEGCFDFGNLFISLSLSVISATIFTIVCALISMIPSLTVEAGRVDYPLVEQNIEGSRYYVVSKQNGDNFDYIVSYLDENSNTKTKTIDGSKAIVHESSKAATITFITKTIPDSWKLWAIKNDVILYQIDIPSMSNVRYE